MLKNTLGYQRMFRVEGPGMAYGFTMNKREIVPCTWPVGSKLFFSRDGESTRGESTSGLILTVTADDAGKTLGTGVKPTETGETRTGRQNPSEKKLVTILLRNTSLLPRKVALISYEPGEPGNGTNVFTMVPLVGTNSFRFPVGTKLYIADTEQVNTVMKGRRIDSDKPFLTVQASDGGKSFNLP